ncbi:hypothetical protein PV327_006967 [Microctonus hyperodae]|uniref:Uncharacterized protein n=1 Tax=Microctonus hyperodae TaxID=165561 RepID=A0AA39F5E2_MICHY|nr:hypothetical protein PV327_006967 [Microctonus hyperodae]
MSPIIQFFVLILLAGINVIIGKYIPPQAKVEPIFPKGFRISIPDENGISLVAYHIRFNEEFDGLEAGTIAVDIINVRKGRWYYGNRDVQLKFGDVIHYWVHVVYNGLGYNLLNQQHVVTAFYHINGTMASIENPSNNGNAGNKPVDKDCVVSESLTIDVSTGIYKQYCRGDLLFEDEFISMNESIWKHVVQFSPAPDYPFVIYRQRELNVKVSNGNLRIIPTLTETEHGRAFVRHGSLTLEKCTGTIGTSDCERESRGPYILPPVMSGSVNTKQSFAFVYGRIEIRAKLPRGDWIYPVIALEPLNNAHDMSYPQLRIAASAGNSVLRSSGGADLSGHVLSGGGIKRNIGGMERAQENPKRFANNLWSDEYHIYELTWTKFRISISVDGVEYGSTRPGVPFDKPYYVTLAVGVGGYKEFPDNCETETYGKPWRNVGSKALFDFYNVTDTWARTWENNAKDLNVDYVKVFAI